MLACTKLNESFSLIDGTRAELMTVRNVLRIRPENASFDPLVKSGFKDPHVYFTAVTPEHKLVVMNGHLHKIGMPESLQSDFTPQEIKEYLQDVVTALPFKPYDYQLKCTASCLLGVRKIALCCTGSGKSLIISLILEFFRRRSKKCLLLVPNINLLTQFKADIESYGLTELAKEVELFGAGNKPTFKTSVLISTWQSIVKYKDKLDKDPDFTYELFINDECHRNAGDVSSQCCSSLLTTKYKFGFTGTLPEDPVLNMRLLGLFGQPERFIGARELIERDLGTPILIRAIILGYSPDTLREFKSGAWAQQLKFLKEYAPRNKLICNLALRLQKKSQNTLILFSHTEHGKTLFRELMKQSFPDVEIRDKDITGKNSFEFQEKYNIFFLNGEDDARTRERTRLILEERIGAVLVSNYAILSTGVNIKALHNLIFASPLKSYNTITQSIGRGIRKHESKKQFTVYDIVDSTGVRKFAGTFYRQYQHRCNVSYNVEEFPIDEIFVRI